MFLFTAKYLNYLWLTNAFQCFSQSFWKTYIMHAAWSIEDQEVEYSSVGSNATQIVFRESGSRKVVKLLRKMLRTNTAQFRVFSQSCTSEKFSAYTLVGQVWNLLRPRGVFPSYFKVHETVLCLSFTRLYLFWC